MALLKQLSMTAVTSAACVALGSFAADSAQAALFKFSFEGEGASGYIIYDQSKEPDLINENIAASYIGAGEYKIDLGEKGVYQGTNATLLVYTTLDNDQFQLQVSAAERQPESEFSFISYFQYPRGTFGGSTALLTTVPSTATAEIYPYVDFPNTQGEAAFLGTVRTRIEKIPESAPVFGLLGVGALFILSRQRKQTQPRISNPLL